MDSDNMSIECYSSATGCRDISVPCLEYLCTSLGDLQDLRHKSLCKHTGRQTASIRKETIQQFFSMYPTCTFCVLVQLFAFCIPCISAGTVSVHSLRRYLKCQWRCVTNWAAKRQSRGCIFFSGEVYTQTDTAVQVVVEWARTREIPLHNSLSLPAADSL